MKVAAFACAFITSEALLTPSPLISKSVGRPSRKLTVVSFDPLGMLAQEMSREAGNLGEHVTWGIVEGTKVVGSGIQYAAPIVGQGVQSAAQAAAPIVRQGFETAAPVLEQYVKDVTPVVNDAVARALNIATPAAQQAADKALVAVRPYFDAGIAVPDALADQARAAVGAEQFDAALQTASKTKSGVASGLRSVASLLDGADESAAPPPQPAKPSRGFVEAALDSTGIEAAVRAKQDEAMAPVLRFEAEITAKVRQFALLSTGGLVGLGLVKQFVEPLERAAQKAFLVLLASGLIYGAIVYGPKAVKIWAILHDDADALASAITTLSL